jgi:hypothetical protein
MSETFVYDGNPYTEVSEQEWRLIQECEQRIARWGKLPFGDLIAYAKHHNLPQEVIDLLQDMEDKAAWLCLAGTEYGVSAFTDALKARKEQPPEDSFCIWCHHRDEREARKFIRDALKTTPRPM